MAVLLHHHHMPSDSAWDVWVTIGADGTLPPERRLDGLGLALEQAFAAIADQWLALGRSLGAEASSRFAHAPACASNISDLGLMMAWSRLVEGWAAESRRVLVLCDDPWLFRHLAALPGVAAGRPPLLLPAAAKGWLRGILARGRLSLRLAAWAWSLRHQNVPRNRPSLLVYGHPRSTADGIDGYFGELMGRMPVVARALHVDCPPARARALAADGRSFSLHGCGNPLFALGLLRTRWRPSAAARSEPWGRLVSRAAAREGATAQAASIRWQLHCQQRWLDQANPPLVAWPWENHSWERAFVAVCRRSGVTTIGYQHSAVGELMLNYRPQSNPAGADGLPDRILCNGAAPRDRLQRLGIPAERLVVAGSVRFAGLPTVRNDPAGPVFVALPFDQAVAAQMVAACRAVPTLNFVVKAHPMTPYHFQDDANVVATDVGLAAQPGVRAVLYAATTVGLEALVAGVPTFRFVPDDRLAIDVMPEGLAAVVVTAVTLASALAEARSTDVLSAERWFAPVDWDTWERALGGK